MATVGERIRQIRDKRGMTQDRLCQEANISKGFLSDVENNKRNISSQKLLEVSNVLGASIDYLLKGESTESIQSGPITIPPELSEAAEQCGGVSYNEILDVLAAQRSIVARRSNKQKKELSVDDWMRLFDTIKGVFG